MSLFEFSTSERNEAEIPVASATSASERLRAFRTWRRAVPTEPREVAGAWLIDMR